MWNRFFFAAVDTIRYDDRTRIKEDATYCKVNDATLVVFLDELFVHGV